MPDLPDPCIVSRPQGPTLPIVVDSPHSGTDYPDDFGHAVPKATLRTGEDTWVDALYATAPRHGATLLAARFPRTYIDPNRDLSDVDEALLDAPWPGPVQPSRKTELGVGLVWRLCAGQAIYDRRLSVAEVQARIERCWRPYHAALGAALDAAAGAAEAGPRWHLNVHSMPDDAYRRLGLPEKPLADVVLGNLDGRTSDEATMRVIEAGFVDAGYSVAWNDPFKGVEIIRGSGDPARGRHSVQIELKRSLYMDAAREPNAGYERMRQAVDYVLARLASHVRGEIARAG